MTSMDGVSSWSNSTGPGEIEQIVTAVTRARFMRRTSRRDQLHGDALHGANLQLGEPEFEKGDFEIEVVLRGNRVRRYKVFDPSPVPKPTVRLS